MSTVSLKVPRATKASFANATVDALGLTSLQTRSVCLLTSDMCNPTQHLSTKLHHWSDNDLLNQCPRAMPAKASPTPPFTATGLAAVSFNPSPAISCSPHDSHQLIPPALRDSLAHCKTSCQFVINKSLLLVGGINKIVYRINKMVNACSPFSDLGSNAMM